MESRIDQGIVELLCESLQSDEVEPPQAAWVTARGPEAVPTLIAVLQGELDDFLAERELSPSEAQSTAAWLLSTIADPASIQPILDIVTRIDPLEDRQKPLNSLWDALAATGSAALEPTLRAYAEAEEPNSRPGLGFVLSRLGVHDERIFPILVETFYEDLFWGAYAMRNYGDLRAVPHLKHALEKFLPHAYGNGPSDIEAEYEAILDALRDLGALSDEESEAFDERLDEHYRRQYEAAQAGEEPQLWDRNPIEVADSDTPAELRLPLNPSDLPN